jgi:hypothetical protein
MRDTAPGAFTEFYLWGYSEMVPIVSFPGIIELLVKPTQLVPTPLTSKLQSYEYKCSIADD